MWLVAEPRGRVRRYKNRREGWGLGPALATELHAGYVAGVGYEARLVVMSGEAERVGCIATGGQLSRGYARIQGNQQGRHEALRRAVNENRVGVMLFAPQYRDRVKGCSGLEHEIRAMEWRFRPALPLVNARRALVWCARVETSG